MSLSARRAWIEIDFAGSAWVPEFVALRKESVDRNILSVVAYSYYNVALRKESVDRNVPGKNLVNGICVALRKESVDRNFYYADKDCDWVRRSPQGERG